MSFGMKALAATALLPALLILVLTGAVGSSDARFISLSHNPGALFASGSITLTNSKSGAAVITATGLLPGSSKSGELSLTAHGDFRVGVTLTSAGITDQPSSPALSQALVLQVQDVTGTPRVIWSGAMGSLSSVSLGHLSSGSTATYRFTVTFPVANAVAGLQNASTTMTLRFTGVAQ
jgi:spore coat-associated protein N